MLHKNQSRHVLERHQDTLVEGQHPPLTSQLELVIRPQIAARVQRKPVQLQSGVVDLLIIASRRCSSFFAEAAVLVLVFGILDYFMLKGRIEMGWIAGAFALSLALLAGSVAMDFSAHRWMKAHP